MKFATGDNRFRVGLVWAGQPKHSNDRNRSIRLSQLESLFRISSAQFYSLQKGAAADQISQLPAGLKLMDWTDELNDFADTAALISNLDLVISVDTAVVHLAATMSKPTWTLLPFSPDWRWLLEHGNSSWYPSVRLFRQKSFGDWNEVVQRVADELAELASNCGVARG